MKRAPKALVALIVGAATLTISGPALAHEVTNGPNIPAPGVLSAYAYSALGAYGGRTLIAARVTTGTTTCQLKLLSHQSFAVSYATNARYCHVNFYAYVIVAANPTPVYRSVAFEVIARNAWGQFSRGMVYLNVAPKGSDYHAPPPPVVTTDPTPPPVVQKAPPQAPTPSVNTVSGVSPNWSGYEAEGSGFTAAIGTFTVPRLDNDETCQTFESQWVGIDGDYNLPGGTNLIQAGITEEPYDSFGDCTAPGSFYLYAWWEVLPEYQTEQNVPSYEMNVNSGDTVTVAITRTSDGDWSLSISDDTNNQIWTSQVPYSGPGNSAEWIDESAADGQECSGAVQGNICPMTDYSGARFWNLQYNHNASVTTLKDVAMEQDLVDVSTPSYVPNLAQLLSGGFTVSYTGY